MIPNQQTFVAIPPYRRELYLRIINDVEDFHLITQRLYFLDDHFPPAKLDHALAWLIASNFVGKSFENWFKIVCKASDLEMHRILISVLANLAPDRLVAGKNFKL